MKENFVKLVFVIDESGSMAASREDVIGGFNTFIGEQKKDVNGDVNVSLYTFEDKARSIFENKNINDVPQLSGENYRPGGMTALNDAVGMAITNTGKELADMAEEDRPSVVMMIIMTDGCENASVEYKSASKIKEMIEHQINKYNWKFIYLGTDITTTEMANSMGIKSSAYSSRANISDTITKMSQSTSLYRCMAVLDADVSLDACLSGVTASYESELGIKIDNK